MIQHMPAELSTIEVAAAIRPLSTDPLEIRRCETLLMQEVEMRRWYEAAHRDQDLYLEHTGFIRRPDGVLELRARLTQHGPREVGVRAENGRLDLVAVPQRGRV